MRASMATNGPANQALAARADFREGVECAVGARKGEVPRWEHASVEEARSDPAVEKMVADLKGAERLCSEMECDPYA